MKTSDPYYMDHHMCCGWMEFISAIKDQWRVGMEFTRQELLQCSAIIKPWTLDTYRQYLESAGYLQRAGRGRYRYICKIPDTLTMRACRHDAYGK
jgi:hypothetical protein